ncbi:hypothetical protein BH10BAC6_BH10BAC6_02050 [soil metagenome]
MIVVFARAPVLGKVKTRLAATIGDTRALTVYRALVEQTVAAVRASTLDFMVACDSEDGMVSVAEWLDAPVFAQRGDDLGDKMLHALMVGLEDDDRAMVIGSDIPFLTPEILVTADTMLEEYDVVIGPSSDGGFYCIGVSGPHIDMFRGVEWSTPTVLRRTLENCEKLQLNVGILPELLDIDTQEDLQTAIEDAHPSHLAIGSMLRSLSVLSALVLLLCLPCIVSAQGGWIKKPGEGFVQVSGQTLSTSSAYDLQGVKTTTEPFTNRSINLYGEVGILPDLMAVVGMPMYRSSAFASQSSASGIGDVVLGVRCGILTEDWPVAAGLTFELPTGNAKATDGVHRLPTGDEELNAWLNVGISHSFWPTSAYVMADVGYNVRGLAVSSFIQQFDGGKFTNQYRLFVKAGYEVATHAWVNLALYRLGTAGTPQAGRFSFNGLGEGVEYNAWDLGGSYAFDTWTLTADLSSAFTAPRAIYGGLNIIVGIMKTF